MYAVPHVYVSLRGKNRITPVLEEPVPALARGLAAVLALALAVELLCHLSYCHLRLCWPAP